MLECQLINIEGVTELENHLFVATVKMDLGKNYQQILKGVGQSLMRNRRATQSQSTFPQIAYKLRKEKYKN